MRKAAPHSERHTFPVSDTSSSMERSERDIPLEERLRMKRSGFATYEESAGGAGDASSAAAGSRAGPEKRYKPREEVAHRANKNRPLELTSKRAVGRFRQAVEVKRRKSVDPRFESVSGRLNEDLFSKAYSFVDDYKQSELEDLRKQLKKSKSKTRKETLKHEINLRAQELTEKKKQDKIKSALSKRKREEREAVASGKNPFYLKRKDKKTVELQAKFQDLQESGRLSKFMAKKRKKNASKDHRWLPTQRKE